MQINISDIVSHERDKGQGLINMNSTHQTINSMNNAGPVSNGYDLPNSPSHEQFSPRKQLGPQDQRQNVNMNMRNVNPGINVKMPQTSAKIATPVSVSQKNQMRATQQRQNHSNRHIDQRSNQPLQTSQTASGASLPANFTNNGNQV